MDNYTSIKVELDIQSHKMINQFMIDNKRIEEEIKSGIKNAFDNIDLEKEVEESVKLCIQEAIKSSGEWGKIREAVKTQTDKIVDEYIQNSINKFRNDFK